MMFDVTPVHGFARFDDGVCMCVGAGRLVVDFSLIVCIERRACMQKKRAFVYKPGWDDGPFMGC